MQPPTLPEPRSPAPAAIFFALALLSGCASSPPGRDSIAPTASPSPETSTAALAPAAPVTRQGRYTLVEIEPAAGQRDLLMQIVEVTLPVSDRATVGGGLQYLLRHSGYRLCAPSGDSAMLYALPLPAAHVHLGPTTLLSALLAMSGNAWLLDVDHTHREMCFRRAEAVGADTTTLGTDQTDGRIAPIEAALAHSHSEKLP
ncbi:PilL N-terminal domain-containing protein [Xanthomonas phaseoli]|uniref:PFGI-1 class ICE element type IV pilus protein PilL2 n=1 Tax=Xanthomonas phaseoli TaxID=1985254 RepID=UPI001238190A|nr:PilL N-terminal domain-containing protein [Xanthomonas phaseoli]MBO9831226.1 PilL N-terminal domain-containing protein [Xanthomonas phaseoli pv. dieffenbachiae]MBO9837561.1 PilL N-terminal domain-containing protein [Xanthomonas phaseoli pv. dieffenbachiae]MBO9839199.1 PilL N-terminal domain-containing protein [Xanthomonas phaseoli pv. dieffenbachiae]MBO9861196.1 PilL N-terminal domain-containing protein [Xanthomonas phaseoli pv. dieffenbachiae]MBO9865072.1 PilL N-terminal domain-containing 